MARFRVKAFFMHESEQAAARRAEQAAVMTDTEWTDGFVIGVIDETAVDGLVRDGLVITPIERIEAAEPQGGTAVRSVRRGGRTRPPAATPAPGAADLESTVAGKRTDDKILSAIEPRARFYVVRLNGPLTEPRRAALQGLGIALIERLSPNSYTARLTRSEVRTLADRPFVDAIRLYGASDTLRGPPAPAATAARGAARRGARAAEPPPFTLIHAVRLHRAEDVGVVTRWLRQRGRRPLSQREDVLRVALPRGGADVHALAALPEVAAIEEVHPTRLLDGVARGILRLEHNGVDIGLAGDGELVGIADTGLDAAHPDFAGRIVKIVAHGRPGDGSDPEGHGTHVAGCAVGDGRMSAGEVRGAAPKARLFFQSILDANGALGGLPENLETLFDEAYQAGVRIHNNSWGAFAYAQYTLASRDIDRFVAAHPDMLIVIAAGNDGTAVARASGDKPNAKPGFVDWPCVAAPATAKNGLSVGASRNGRRQGGYARLKFGEVWKERFPKAPIGNAFVSGDPECLAAFSGRGPCSDNRIKPDLVAPGTDIAAARSSQAPMYKFWGAYPNNKHYAYMGGTSMAAPYVAGCAALVREHFAKAGWPTPSAALLKATLINGTRRLTGDDATAPEEGAPNFHQGFGCVDMAATIPNPLTPGLQLVFIDTWTTPVQSFTKTGQRFRWELKVGPHLPLRLCLAWTDPPVRALQNSLMLAVDAQGEKFVGNDDAARTLKIAGMRRDPDNNVQVVRIDRVRAGTVTIAVTATTLLDPTQAFALVVSGDLRSPLNRLP